MCRVVIWLWLIQVIANFFVLRHCWFLFRRRKQCSYSWYGHYLIRHSLCDKDSHTWHRWNETSLVDSLTPRLTTVELIATAISMQHCITELLPFLGTFSALNKSIQKMSSETSNFSDVTYNNNGITSSAHLRSTQRPFRSTSSMTATSPDHA